jgi:transglutaminase-like putative cysteine protease
MYLRSVQEPRIYLGRIPRGYAGTRKTVGYIVELIKQGAKDFCVRQEAIDILIESRVRPKDYPGEIRTLFEWVKNNVRYTRDIYRVELLHSARRMLELRAGDCDDMTILLSAMLKAVGHPVRLVLVGFNPERKKLFSHIYLEAFCRGAWIALDPTMNRPMGWAPPADHKRVFAVD